MFDTLPRPDVTADRYRELEAIAMQVCLQLPHHDLGECRIIMDIVRNTMRRWHNDDRVARHQPAQAIADEINSRNVVKLISGGAA